MAKLGPDWRRAAIARLHKRISEVEALDPSNLEIYSPDVDALQARIDDTLSWVFGPLTDKYNRYRRTVNWAADIPVTGAEATLKQYRDDVAKGKRDVVAMLTAAAASLEEEMPDHNPGPASLATSTHGAKMGSVFIGHGRSPLWRELKDFLVDRLHLTADEFNNVATAGVATAARLTQMLEAADFALIIMTAEDEQPDGKIRARENVVHESGLFQGRLGFERAIILLEDGCEEFSNVHGLGQIQFPKGNIRAVFEDIRKVLEREKLIK